MRRRRLAFAFALILLAGGACAPRRNATVAAFDPDSIPEAYATSTAALMWPLATRSFQVRPDGDLYNGEWLVTLGARGQAGVALPPRVIAYENRSLPVAHWRRWSGRLRWDFEATALPVSESNDSVLVVSLLARATNTGDAPDEAALVTRIEPPVSPPFVAPDVPDTPRLGAKWDDGARRDSVCGWADGHGVGDSGLVARHAMLAPGASAEFRLVLPSFPIPAEELRHWARVPHAKRANQARDYWTARLAEGTRFELGDPEAERALDAARVVMLACRERRGPYRVPIGAPLHYRDIWLRDGARVIAALAVSGHVREARELADGLLLLQWPMGPFMSQRGQLDGTGQALWAFEQAALRPAADDDVDRFANAALRSFHWFEWQHWFAGSSSTWPFAMMQPFGEPRDNEVVRAQLVGNDAWSMAGYAAAARLLRAAHHDLEADSVEIALARYRADFETALRRSHAADLPPSWQGPGRDWGNLSVAWPCRALPYDDPRCAAVAWRVWRSAGGAGLLTYGTPDSLHYYMGADLGTWAMFTGRRAEADSVIDAMLHWRSASGGAGELFHRAGGFGGNLPPHATSAAALVAVLRNALIFDDGDTLRLTLGARDPWWRHSKVQRAPTFWGTIDLEFSREGNQASWRWTAVPVWTELALPPGTRAANAPPSPLRAGRRPGVVLAPPGTTEARVTLVAEGS